MGSFYEFCQRMRLCPHLLISSGLVFCTPLQASEVGIIDSFTEAGSIFEGRSPEAADMVCSGTLVMCDMVLTAAHCLQFRHVAGNQFWFYLQHSGLHEIARDELALFCDTHDCSGPPESFFDLALLRLNTLAWKAQKTGSSVDATEQEARFVGYGIKPPKLDSYNIKRISSIRLSKCDFLAGENHTLCSNLDDETPTPCHKDSGGPLYAESEGGEYILKGIAIRTGVGCRAGQAIYNDMSSPVIQAWLEEHTSQSTNRCKKNTQKRTEILNEPEGWLDEKTDFQELEIEVANGLDELLVSLNHAPGEILGEAHNDFDLKLYGPENNAKSLIPYCDNTWKLLSICRVPSPTEGTWKARVTRKHGEGHFQLVASGISR